LFSLSLSLISGLGISVTRIKCKKRWASGEEVGLQHSIGVALSCIFLAGAEQIGCEGSDSVFVSSSVIIPLLLCLLLYECM